MQTKQVSTWAEIRDAVEAIEHQYSKTVIDGVEQTHLILFRGLADSTWRLETTLERQSKQSWTVRSYYRQIYFCAPQIESFLGTSWHLGTVQDTDKDVDAVFSNVSAQLPHYDYWAYLRHHEFPSPLLDWTKSPYIALFFAVCEHSNADQASLYAYVEMPSGGKGGIVGAPMITVQHPYVRTHKRHFLQQSHYTVATEIDEEYPKDHRFIPHEEVFQLDKKDQDILIKIVFPRSLRQEILRTLDTFNINYYSLFQSEDSLVKTLALKELELP